MLTGDWRKMDTSLIEMDFNKNRTYLLATRSVGTKGWLGGKHSFIYWFSQSQQKWLTVEITDHETLEIQKAKIVLKFTNDFLKMAPFITMREANQRWFGAKPRIIDSIELNISDEDMYNFVTQYPIKEYQVFTQNCNTFTSFLNHQIKLKYGKNFRISCLLLGYRTSLHWNLVEILNFDSNKIRRYLNI